MSSDLKACLEEIRACTACAGEMARRPNPILQAAERARILIASQAPGNLADTTGTAFNDPSGRRLRSWLGMDETVFYDRDKVAIVPMGFCFPGYDRNGGDRPPMRRCATLWRQTLLDRLPDIRLTVLIGAYAQAWHLGARRKSTLTETVQCWKEYKSERIFTLPHPSWRNTAWLKRNPWFETDVLPALRNAVDTALASPR